MPLRHIQIRPSRGCWQAFEAPGVEPFFLEKADAISFRRGRAQNRRLRLVILDSSGGVESVEEIAATSTF